MEDHQGTRRSKEQSWSHREEPGKETFPKWLLTLAVNVVLFYQRRSVCFASIFRGPQTMS